MSANPGIFGWIRDGVRQSVLLGVNDALETLGTPETSRDLNPVLAGLLKQSDSGMNQTENIASGATKRIGSTAGRKRLGRSLRDINPSAQNAP